MSENRAAMVRAFQAAFDEWDRRAGAGKIAPALAGDPNRGTRLADLLDELAEGKPWMEIAHVD